jgi:hypothetical protein
MCQKIMISDDDSASVMTAPFQSTNFRRPCAAGIGDALSTKPGSPAPSTNRYRRDFNTILVRHNEEFSVGSD